ncbi:MAG: 2-phosphosulfolactate phosphatase, partial [Gemmatimonadales bacterium]
MVFSPAGVTAADVMGRSVVVIDVLRASTTIAVALMNGAKAVLPAGSTEEALRIAQNLEKGDV